MSSPSDIGKTESSEPNPNGTEEDTQHHRVLREDDDDDEFLQYGDAEGILSDAAVDPDKLSYYQNMGAMGEGANSSDEEDNNPYATNATDIETNSDDEQAQNAYEPLGEEFGEFVSSANDAGVPPIPEPTDPSLRNFATWIEPTGIFRKNGMDGPMVLEEEDKEQPATSPADEGPLIPNIAPLSQDKIDTIKQAMSKITIKMPNFGTASVADAILNSKLRLGDESSATAV